MLQNTLGCPLTFELRRQELRELKGQSDVSDEDVVESFPGEELCLARSLCICNPVSVSFRARCSRRAANAVSGGRQTRPRVRYAATSTRLGNFIPHSASFDGVSGDAFFCHGALTSFNIRYVLRPGVLLSSHDERISWCFHRKIPPSYRSCGNLTGHADVTTGTFSQLCNDFWASFSASNAV